MRAGHRAQDAVTDRMAVGLVDRLETVEVDEQQRQPALPGVGGAGRLLQPVFEHLAVRQLGQRVERCLLAQLDLGARQRFAGVLLEARGDQHRQHEHQRADRCERGQRASTAAARDSSRRPGSPARPTSITPHWLRTTPAAHRHRRQHIPGYPAVRLRATDEPDAQAERRAADAGQQGNQQPRAVPDETRLQAHRQHAEQLRTDQPEPDAAGRAEHRAQPRLARTDHPESGHADTDGSQPGREDTHRVIADRIGERLEVHAQHVHRPHPGAPGQARAEQPLATLGDLGRVHALAEVERDVRRQARDQAGEQQPGAELHQQRDHRAASTGSGRMRPETRHIGRGGHTGRHGMARSMRSLSAGPAAA